MKKLTDYQKRFIMNEFFMDERFTGWKGIAETLLEDGKCIVAGSDCIWKGGIGNFIKTEPAKGTIGCILYTFDLDNFLKSEWYKEVNKSYYYSVSNKIEEVENKLQELIKERDEIYEI